MMKKDGKDIYTFTGLINRMEACRYRDYRFTEKDIPEEVEFKGTRFILTNDKTAYANPENGESLAETVAVYYGGDLNKYLTEHEFIVTPKKKIFLTSEEREFLRLSNAIMGWSGVQLLAIRRRQSSDETSFLIVYFGREDGSIIYEEGFPTSVFLGLTDDETYMIDRLGIYD